MARKILLLLLILNFFSCDDNAPDLSSCGDGTCSAEIFTDAKIETVEVSQEGLFADIANGDRTVFRRTFIYNDRKEIIDDELTEILLFELDPDEKSFLWKDNELEEAGVLFGRFCYCAWHGYVPVRTGLLEGRQISPGIWRIRADLKVNDATGSLKFETLFN